MVEITYNNLLIVVLISLGAPLLIGFLPFIRVPAPVLLIIAGIVVGPALHWVKADAPVQILSLLGLGFLLFLAGLEIDPQQLRGRFLRLAGIGYALSLAIAVAVGLLVGAAGLTRSPLLIAIALSSTSLGLIVPILVDAGVSKGDVGQLTIGGSSVADFLAVVLVSVFFSASSGSLEIKLILLGGFGLMVVFIILSLSRIGRSMRLNRVLVMLQDTTAEIRVRFAVVLLIAFVALAARFGLEAILGAFVAGIILNLVDKDTESHPNLRIKLDAIGYGFLIPVFFVNSGLGFDLKALLHSPSAFARIPVFLVALLLVRGIPALLYQPIIGWKNSVAAGLLQATSLPFLVIVSQIGVTLKTIKPVTGAALVSAGVLSCVIFPLVSLTLLRGASPEPAPVPRPQQADR